MTRDSWASCYGEQWQGLIVPEAFAHPAKFSRALIQRIYDHCREEGWLPEGATVIDPFGGVALGAADAMRLGCHWVGIELEQKFVDLGNQNIALWNRRFGRLPHWGQAVLLHGDSRTLLTWAFAAPGAACVVASPPFAESLSQKSGGSGILDPSKKEKYSEVGITRWKHSNSDYGTSPANLGNMPTGSVEAVIASPPFTVRQPTANARPGEETELRKMPVDTYGTSPGQLAAMPEGPFSAVVSSPPYEEGLGHDSGHPRLDATEDARREREGCRRRSGYGDGEMGTGDTFWASARQIVEQCYLAIKPGGHAVWVVKAYVRSSKLVDFPDQWRQLCEAVGFVTLHEHRAMLVEDRGIQRRTDGGEDKRRKERKSFFRRDVETKAQAKRLWPMIPQRDQVEFTILARQQLPIATLKKVLVRAQVLAYRWARSPVMEGAPRIDYEIVLCMERR